MSHKAFFFLPMATRLSQLQQADPELGPLISAIEGNLEETSQKSRRDITARASNFAVHNGVLHYVDNRSE